MDRLVALLIDFLGGFRLWTIIPADEGGVRLRCGKKKGQALGPGWHWQIPVLDEIQIVSLRPQVINLPNQSLTTTDGLPIAVSCAIGYWIPRPDLALLEVQNFDVSLQNIAMGVVSRYVMSRTYDDLSEAELCQVVLEGIRDEALGWGLKIQRVYLHDLIEHRAYRIMTHEQPEKLVVLDDE